MDTTHALPEVPRPRCVFCGQPVADAESCPLLPSSHWSCCACAVPAAVATSPTPATDPPAPHRDDAA